MPDTASEARNRLIRRVVLDTSIAAAVVIGMGVIRGFYSNELMLFNFVVFLALAQGLNIIYGFTGYLPFGYVGFYGAGAYGFSLAVMHLHVPALVGMTAAAAAALILAVILLPLLRLSGAYFAIASMAAAQAVYEIVANPDLESITKGPYGVSLSDVFAPAFSYYTALAILAGTLLLVVWLRNSRFGMSLQAIRDDSVSAAMAGVSVVRGRTIAWLLSALVAGLVGGVFAWHISVFFPDTAFDLSISIFSTVFLLFGGATTLSGPLLGVFILYGFYNVIGIAVPQYFQFAYGALIVLLVLFLPNGLVSLLTSRGIRVPEPLLNVEGLVKRFGGFRALDGVTFHLRAGEVLGLVGPNGSGKTTCINVICGLYVADGGSITYDGRSIVGAKSHRLVKAGINRTFQSPRPFLSLTVRENIEVAAHYGDPRPGFDVDALLALLELDRYAQRPAAELNSAQQKTLDLARAMATEPKLLLVDELAAGLNPAELSRMADRLRLLADSGMALLVVEHLMGFIDKVTDRVVVMAAGKEFFGGTLADATRDPEVIRVFLGGGQHG